MAEIFFSILTVSVSMTPIIVVMIILAPLFNRIYKSSWKYWMWLGISLRLMLPFSIGFESPILIEFPTAESLITGSVMAHGTIPMEDNIVNAVNSTGISLNIMEILAVIYFAGAVIFMMLKLINYFIFRKNIQKWCAKPTEETLETALNIVQMFGINVKKQKLNVYICRKIPGPMVIGIFRPMLLLPGEDYDYIKLKMILSHEAIHIKRHDTSYKFLLVIVCAIHWFNPFVHIMSRKANNDMEISCDSKALQDAGIEEKKIYSLMIIDIASQDFNRRFPVLFTSFVSEKESLEARIKSIFSSVSKKEGHISLILVIIIALLFGTVIQIGNPAIDDEKAYNQLSQAELYPKPIISDAADTDNDVDINKDDINETGSNIKQEQLEQDKKLNIYSNSEFDSNSNSQIPNTAIQDTESQHQEIDKGDNESSESAEIVIIDLNQLNNNEDS